ncbi:MAG: metallophosphoesterase [Pirellulaceae bacterium]
MTLRGAFDHLKGAITFQAIDSSYCPLMFDAMQNRLIAIGDIHGSADALQTMISLIEPNKNDTFVILGDVIDRGPQSKRVVELLLDLAANHRQIDTRKPRGNDAASASRETPQYWLQFGGIDTLESYDFSGDFSVFPESHMKYYEGMLDYFETDDFFFTHASYQHDLPWSTRHPNSCGGIRYAMASRHHTSTARPVLSAIHLTKKVRLWILDIWSVWTPTAMAADG